MVLLVATINMNTKTVISNTAVHDGTLAHVLTPHEAFVLNIEVESHTEAQPWRSGAPTGGTSTSSRAAAA
jgi:hypothetical protein